MAVGLAEPGHQVHHARVLVIGLACVVRFDFLELCHVFGADQRGLVAEAAGGLEELLLVATRGLSQHAQGREAGLLGDAFASCQDVFDGIGLIGDLIFDVEGGAVSLILAEEVERGFRDVEAE